MPATSSRRGESAEFTLIRGAVLGPSAAPRSTFDYHTPNRSGCVPNLRIGPARLPPNAKSSTAPGGGRRSQAGCRGRGAFVAGAPPSPPCPGPPAAADVGGGAPSTAGGQGAAGGGPHHAHTHTPGGLPLPMPTCPMPRRHVRRGDA